MEKIQKTDRRTRYTCQTIKDILLEELKTKPYSKITVTEICKKAEMNRGTFYLHYYDIEKLADLGKEDFITRLMKNSLLTFEQAEAVFYFQMNGCLAINRMMLKNQCTDWTKIQQTIDQFIKGGLETFLIHDQREEIL